MAVGFEELKTPDDMFQSENVDGEVTSDGELKVGWCVCAPPKKCGREPCVTAVGDALAKVTADAQREVEGKAAEEPTGVLGYVHLQAMYEAKRSDVVWRAEGVAGDWRTTWRMRR